MDENRIDQKEFEERIDFETQDDAETEKNFDNEEEAAEKAEETAPADIKEYFEKMERHIAAVHKLLKWAVLLLLIICVLYVTAFFISLAN